MRNPAVVKFDGEFVLGTAYGAQPECLGLDLYRKGKDPVTIIGASRLWGIEYVRGGMTGFCYGDNFSQKPKPHRVQVVDIEDPEREGRKITLDAFHDKLTQKERLVVTLRYIQDLDFRYIGKVLSITEKDAEQTYMGVTTRLRDCVDFKRKEKFHLGICDAEYDVLPHGDIVVRTGTSPDSIDQRLLSEVLPSNVLDGLSQEQIYTRKVELVNRYSDILDELEKVLPDQRKVLDALRRRLNFGNTDTEQYFSPVSWNPGELGEEYLRLVTREHETRLGKIQEGIEKLEKPEEKEVARLLGESEASMIRNFMLALSGKLDDFQTLSALNLDEFFSILLFETGDPFRFAPIEVLKRKYLR